MNGFVLRAPSTIHFGENVALKVGDEVKRFGGKKKPLIVTDIFLASSGAIDPIIASIKAAGLQYAIYAGVDKEPTMEHVDGCLAIGRESQCDLIVAVGGGSPIDVGKAVSFMATNPGQIQDYMGLDKIGLNALPLIAVPTTAGTGSEATATTIITDTVNDVKMLIISPRIIPKVALIDPLLTLGMPKGLTAATGLDALTHAIEAYVSRKAQPYSDLYALSAVKLIYKNLPVAWAEPGNVEARSKTLLGALQAGMAFSNASVALVHGMSRPVGAIFHVAHGVSNAALLGEVMDFSLSGNYARYADIAMAMGLPNLNDDVKTAQSGADKVRQLIKDLEVPTLTELGVTKEKLDPVVSKMADDAIASGSPANNPRLATKEEIITLYHASL
ncbi:MAG: iron-containing alcohol dehydrogenase [Deltaproteobacteria bacterium]|jgi:alcohol dehydrogenase|nr:iron-containing alcohol dehydrogenase [Deltaproteobacteria bacterium]